MATRCLKGHDGPAYRVYAQVTSPKTKHSTSVPLGVFCGTLGIKNGLGAVLTERHGIVRFTGAQTARQRREGLHRSGGGRSRPSQARGKAPAAARKRAAGASRRAKTAKRPAATGTPIRRKAKALAAPQPVVMPPEAIATVGA